MWQHLRLILLSGLPAPIHMRSLPIYTIICQTMPQSVLPPKGGLGNGERQQLIWQITCASCLGKLNTSRIEREECYKEAAARQHVFFKTQMSVNKIKYTHTRTHNPYNTEAILLPGPILLLFLPKQTVHWLFI